jgi:uncharacterized membrane protein
MALLLFLSHSNDRRIPEYGNLASASPSVDKRADVDLQIDLLAEHKITHLIAIVAAIADRVGVDTASIAELTQLERDVAPKQLLDEIQSRAEQRKKK